MSIAARPHTFARTGATQADELVLEFVNRLRRHPWLVSAHFVYMCERNTGQESGHQAVLLARLPKIYCMQEKAGCNPGVWTDKYRKQDFATDLRYELLNNSICFMEDMVCCPPTEARIEERRTWVRRETCAQMRRARPLVGARSGTNSTVAFIGWSAKCNDQGQETKGLNDDLLMGLCINVYFAARFVQHQLPFVDYSVFEKHYV